LKQKEPAAIDIEDVDREKKGSINDVDMSKELLDYEQTRDKAGQSFQINKDNLRETVLSDNHVTMLVQRRTELLGKFPESDVE